MRYLSVSVLSVVGFPDCTNNGFSFTHPQKLVIECEHGSMSYEDVVKHGYIILKLIDTGVHKYFVPEPDLYKNFSSGGNFAYAQDGRFREMFKHPIPICDKVGDKLEC